MVFADCGPRISLSRRICLLTLLVVVAGRFVPAAVRAEAQEDQTLQLRERRQTLVDSGPRRPFRGLRVRVHTDGSKIHADGAKTEDATPQCSSPLVSYSGGPVISNVQVVVVYWNSNVNATAQANLPAETREAQAFKRQ